MKTLNEVFSPLSGLRRYEVWFLRVGLADSSGAWWFRYLLMNPGRGGCANPEVKPVQVWATRFPRDGKPQTFIEGFPLPGLNLSARGQSPFYFRIGNNEISEDSCRGALQVDGHAISWDLRYRSTFCVTISNKGWIGFSRTPHSDAVFSGRITFDGRVFDGDPVGFGIQGHNCGYRHRNFWKWAHACFLQPAGPPSTLEALVYEMPFGLLFRKAVLWHDGKPHVVRNLREVRNDRQDSQWSFQGSSQNGLRVDGVIDGHGPNLHRLYYQKTDCSGTFEVFNNSLAKATVTLLQSDGSQASLETLNGAVLEIGGQR